MIYTFYSYKGGVGRSMALANVAELFYRAGLNVLMVDWDLEAPGLERFFPVKLEEVLGQPGIINMLLDYKEVMEQEPPDQAEDSPLPFKGVESYVVDIYPVASAKGRLRLLPAGRRANKHFAEYANAVLSFDWKDFYKNWEGAAFFEWLRQQFEETADVVLIDSRTGVTEMGGVCSYQLADAVVMFCTANQQSINGTYELARRFRTPEVTELRHGRALNVLIVPARIEKAESKLLDEFQGNFAKVFSKFVPEEEGIDVQHLWGLGIPYIPKYAFTEGVAIRETGKASAEDMSMSFREIGLMMLRLGSYDLFQQVSSQVAVKSDQGFRKLRVFVALSSDMAIERAKIEMVVSMLKPLADNLSIGLDVIDWRSAVPDLKRPEQVIFDQLKLTSWDVFIGVLWHRFGLPLTGRDPQTQKEDLSGAEEEFKIAYRLWEQYGKPRIMIYRCTRAISPDAFDPEHFQRVKKFFAQFDAVGGERPGLYQSFDTTEAFEKLLINNLQKLLLEYGEQLRGKPIEPEVIQTFTPKAPNNLPRRAPFYGRDQELGAALRALSPEDRTWGVLLDGIGGIGKTALAVEAAYRCKERGLFDAFIFIAAKQNILATSGIHELRPAARTLEEFLNETARVLDEPGIAQLADDDKRRALLDALRRTRALLIYDNLETMTKEEQESLADFMRELPQGCKAIITSRRRGGEGALWLRLEKLEWEAAHAIIESEMMRDSQLANKLQRAGEARWQELYDETKGSPLALMYILGLIRASATLTFDAALEMLRTNRASGIQKFIFQEARQELTANDATALRTLSFFVPSATFEAWMQVADLSRNALETTIDRLSALALVDVLVGEERYALHPLTRDFVRDELLADAQRTYEIGTRFASYWVGYAQRYGGRRENYKIFNLLETEWANLDAAAQWLWQAAAVQGEKVGDKEAARSLNVLADNLRLFLWYHGRWDERAQLSAQAYVVMCALSNWRAAGWRAFDVAWIHYMRANIDEAGRWADLYAEAWAREDSKREQAVGMWMHGLLAVQRGDYSAAARLYQDALTIQRALDSYEDVIISLNDLGKLEHNRKQYDVAERYYLEGLELSDKNGLKGLQATISVNLSLLAVDCNRWQEARVRYEKAYQLACEVGRQDLIGISLDGLARVHEAEGQLDRALQLAREAQMILARLRHMHVGKTQAMVERLKQKVSNG
jgi:MinD-like ATPase involved in chromosome partitioning or flagellar assembly